MRALFLLALLVPPAACADLYRWVDPDTGSVKFSNYPPPAPVAGVERIPYVSPFQPPVSQPQPASKPAKAYQAVRAELDRVDPAGAARRRAEDEPLLAKFTRGVKAQAEPARPPKQ